MKKETVIIAGLVLLIAAIVTIGYSLSSGIIFQPKEVAVSTTYRAWTSLFNIFVILSINVVVVVFGYLVVETLRYRARPGQPDPEDAPKLGEIPREVGQWRKILVSVVLSAIVLAALVVGSLALFEEYERPPAGTLDVKVVAFQWGWKFVYSNGHEIVGELKVPKDEVVRLWVTSEDVFHNFGILQFRIKTDAIPGKTNMIWFQALEAGTYNVLCFELCGVGHTFMKGKITVMEPKEFSEWYSTLKIT